MPNRLIRQGFLDSEKINSLPEKEQNFFVRLMLIVDDYGRYDARSKLIKSMCYPVSDYSQSIVSKMLSTLKSKELIELYSVKGKNYLQIIEFNQRLRQKKERYPSPENADVGQLSDNGQSDVGLKRSEVEEKKKRSEVIHKRFDHLSITKPDYKKLCDEFGTTVVNNKMNYLENYRNNNKYKSMYKTLFNWLSGDVEKSKPVPVHTFNSDKHLEKIRNEQ